MDVITYKAIQDMNPWNYTEHQAANASLSASSLTTLLSVTGRGYLNSAIIYNPSGSTHGNAWELKITIDGVIVLDAVQGSGTPNVNEAYAILPNYVDALYFENLWGRGYTAPSSPSVIQFPSAAAQSVPIGYGAIVKLDSPIYFKQSLLVEVKGSISSGNLYAAAKARY